MKKVLSAVLSAVLMCSPVATVQAKVGDVVGKAYNTDIVAYINHYAIPSYAVNGTSCIVAEDLRNFGFDVEWDNSSRSLTLKRNNQTQIHEMNFRKEAAPSSEFADLLETDISVYADGTKLTSYAINGYTFIPLEELKTRVDEALNYDEFEWLKTKPNIRYKHKTMAEGLENILCRCPSCHGRYTIRTHKKKVFCEKCGFMREMDTRYAFTEPAPFENFAKWYKCYYKK